MCVELEKSVNETLRSVTVIRKVQFTERNIKINVLSRRFIRNDWCKPHALSFLRFLLYFYHRDTNSSKMNQFRVHCSRQIRSLAGLLPVDWSDQTELDLRLFYQLQDWDQQPGSLPPLRSAISAQPQPGPQYCQHSPGVRRLRWPRRLPTLRGENLRGLQGILQADCPEER